MLAATSETAQRKAVGSLTVKTLLAGDVTVDDSKVISFDEPLVGYDSVHRCILFQTQEGPLYWLQSIDDEKYCFSVMAPFQAGLDPDMPINQADMDAIGATGVDDVDVYTIVILEDDPSKTRTNLRAPILVSRSTNRAKQVILDNQNLPIRFFLQQGS